MDNGITRSTEIWIDHAAPADCTVTLVLSCVDMHRDRCVAGCGLRVCQIILESSQISLTPWYLGNDKDYGDIVIQQCTEMKALCINKIKLIGNPNH